MGGSNGFLFRNWRFQWLTIKKWVVQMVFCLGTEGFNSSLFRNEIGRAHVWTPVTRSSRMPSSAWKKKNTTPPPPPSTPPPTPSLVSPLLLSSLPFFCLLSLSHFPFREFFLCWVQTYAGPIVISVNPFQDLSIESDKYKRMYHCAKMGYNPPHVFALSERAYAEMWVLTDSKRERGRKKKGKDAFGWIQQKAW